MYASADFIDGWVHDAGVSSTSLTADMNPATYGEVCWKSYQGLSLCTGVQGDIAVLLLSELALKTD